MLQEFKQFLFRGNLIDLAVALVIGLAFTALVTAFVADLITPIIAAIFGSPDFSAYYFTDQRQCLPVRRVLQRAAFVRGGRGSDLLLRREADERHLGTAPHRGRRGHTARVPRVPDVDSRRGPALRGLHGRGAAGRLTTGVERYSLRPWRSSGSVDR